MLYQTIVNPQQQFWTDKLPYPSTEDGEANCGRDGPWEFSFSSDPPPLPEDARMPELIVNEWRTPLPTPRQSFTKIKQSGFIKMSDYRVGREEIRHFLGSSPIEGGVTFWWPSTRCGEKFNTLSPRTLISTWTEQFDLSRILVKRPNLRHYKVSDDSYLELANKINQVKAAVVSDNLATFDLLTELAEGREALSFIASALSSIRNPLATFKRLREELSTGAGAHKKITDLWMQYRYAIMPVVYSVQDAMDLYEKSKDIYKTSRAGGNHSISSDARPTKQNEDNFLYDQVHESYRISATGKARYSLASLRFTDQISVNPFVTAWELIPYSFVVDWFLNVGDWVQAQTSSLADLSSQRAFCCSVKEESTCSTFYHNRPNGSWSRTYDTWGGRSGVLEYSYENPGDHLLRTIKRETYDRHVFTPTDVRLSISPGLTSWKRWIDAYVLSLRPIMTALRRLR